MVVVYFVFSFVINILSETRICRMFSRRLQRWKPGLSTQLWTVCPVHTEEELYKILSGGVSWTGLFSIRTSPGSWGGCSRGSWSGRSRTGRSTCWGSWVSSVETPNSRPPQSPQPPARRFARSPVYGLISILCLNFVHSFAKLHKFCW